MTQSATAKKKILLVEDHLLFRGMLVQLIEKELGMTVCGVADHVQDALAIIEQTRPDAVIVDLKLDGSTGLELIEDLHARHLSLPLLVLLMDTDLPYAERVLRAGATGYVSKEESPVEVAAAIRAVMAGQIYGRARLGETTAERHGSPDQAVPATEVNVLSPQEQEVFQLVGQGLTSREIAGRLRLVSSEVASYRARIKDKLDINNAAELYQRATQWVAQRGL